MEQQIVAGLAKVITFFLEGALDWRMWFVHCITWIAIGRLKHAWDHMRPLITRRRFTELVSGVVAVILTARVFYDDPRMVDYMIANFFLNPVIYKVIVGVLEWKFPRAFDWLGFKKYEVVETSDGGLAIREDGQKTVRLTPKQINDYRGEEK